MQAQIRLLKNEKILGEFIIPYENLKKDTIESSLDDIYELRDGYEISYIDTDGDEITVEFDEDYEVARLTHQETKLVLNVNITNQEWVKEFTCPKKQMVEQLDQIQHSIIKDDTQLPVSVVEIDLLSGDILIQQISSQQKLQSQFKEPNLRQDLLKQKNQTKIHIEPAPFDKQGNLKPIQTEETQNISKFYAPIQIKRTETQSSELSSVQSATQVKPEKKPALELLSDYEPFVQQINENETNQVLQPKKLLKIKEKKKKQVVPKPEKRKKSMTEKDIQKLVKKEVFKLLPQLAQMIKSEQEAEESQTQNAVKVTKFKSSEKFDFSLLCSVCSQDLKVPFYINSIQGIKLCKKCEETDSSTCPLIKIRDQKMIENLNWAEPVCIASKIKSSEQKDPVKFYSELKKKFLDSMKDEFDQRIKTAKKEMKKQKKQISKKEKEMKQIKQESLI